MAKNYELKPFEITRLEMPILRFGYILAAIDIYNINTFYVLKLPKIYEERLLGWVKREQIKLLNLRRSGS